MTHSIGSGWVRVSHLEGREPISDDEVRALLEKGWFLQQIRKKYKIGIARLRAIDRAPRMVPA